ncbi:MAG TPA: hypothetical protein VK194_03395, partial [Candidatus Deferrimicrobium sp.]|nr:hypothetical protein [Candidatus Deferrimicrobium sp.]
MFTPLDELDARDVVAAAQAMTERRRAIEVEDLQLAARWADLHGADPLAGPGGRRRWDDGGDRLVQVGGEGTPLVQELSLCELAVARQVHTLRLRAMLADVLDLRHRLPLTWAVVEELGCEVWLARKVAALSRHLSAAAVHVVDLAVADAIAGEAPARVLAVAEAKIIEADPAGHAARVEAERRRRYVALSRTDAHGLRHLIARVEAGEAVWVDAMIDRVADLLTARPDLRPDLPTDAGRDELRATALGWLARPEDLLDLLQHPDAPQPANGPDTETDTETGDATPARRPA